MAVLEFQVQDIDEFYSKLGFDSLDRIAKKGLGQVIDVTKTLLMISPTGIPVAPVTVSTTQSKVEVQENSGE